ncbi:MAG: [protein-PII] uridylyltransferase [Desulfobacterales bacterium]
MVEHTATHLRQKRERLIQRHFKEPAESFLGQHADIIDEYFFESFGRSVVGPQMNIDKKPYAIIALGGYGRREQCVCSDIDLLFLFKRKVPAAAEKLIQEIVYPLWDLGYEVGHATRSLKDSLALARDDLDVFTSMLDARFICGISSLYTELQEKLISRVISGHSKKLISNMVERNRERHIRYGDSTYLLEPNIKEGQGGLRDYHTMLWAARITSKLKNPRDLEYYGYLSHEEYGALKQALNFIWLVRNHLHQLSGRKTDQLSFSSQEELAQIMRFKKSGGQMAVEKFLGELHGQMELIKQYNLMILSMLGYSYDLKPTRKPAFKSSNVDGLHVSRSMLYFSSIQELIKSPELFLKIFEESVRLKMPLSAEAKRLIREFSYLVDKDFRSSHLNIKVFERILLTPAVPFNVLNEMLNTGFLSSFIPEIKRIVNRIQYNTYHLYPVDRHTLFTVRTIKNFSSDVHKYGDRIYADLYSELGARKILLLWAALLHDIGKGWDSESHSGKGAEIARIIMARGGYAPWQIETVSFLVREHLFLIKTATRRDINDEETAIACARRIGDPKLLKMLYLLTVGDSMSTGPTAWNDWIATLLRDLFFKVLKILEKGEFASLKVVDTLEKKKADVIGFAETEHEKQVLEAHFAVLSPRYMLSASAEEIHANRTLYQRLGEREFVWDIFQDLESGTRKVTVCAKDRPGLFSKIAGVFTMKGLDILDAQAYTWRNNIALDIFRVKPPADQIFETEKWERAASYLEQALSGDLDLIAEVKKKMVTCRKIPSKGMKKPHRINIDNKSSSFFTIVEVFTDDFPGLLFSITDAIYSRDLNVHVAIITTKVDQVVDIFYVRNIHGEKIDAPEEVEALKSAIEKRLPV